MTEQTETMLPYDTIAAAETAIVLAGYYRNKTRCLWEHAGTRICVKVVRDEKSGKFIVQTC